MEILDNFLNSDFILWAWACYCFIDFSGKKTSSFIEWKPENSSKLAQNGEIFKILMVKTATTNFKKLKILKYAQNRP